MGFLTKVSEKITRTINLLQGKHNGRKVFRKTKHNSGCPNWTIQHVRETMRRCRDIQNGRVSPLSRVPSLEASETKGVSQ